MSPEMAPASSWAPIGRIVFICAGNICRSPMAEHAFRLALTTRELNGIEIASFGLVARDGDVPVEATLRAAAAVGLDLSAHRARRFEANRLRPTDRAWVMEHSQRDEVLRRATLREVQLLGSLVPHGTDEIADPEEGDEDIFDACATRIVACVDGLAGSMQR